MDNAYTLRNGIKIPKVGFGTWQISPDSLAEKVVHDALLAGYRHIDTAKLYANEQGVGAAVQESGIPREELFVTTKLWNSDQGYDSALRAMDASLERLGLDYVDLYLIHWPQTGTRLDAWKALVEIQKSGKAKSIGVSNFSVRHLSELMEASDVVPVVNQVEFHPFIYEEQKELLDICARQNILVEAYSPLARHSKSVMPAIETIANSIGKSSSQILLRWCVQHGTAPLPRSTNPEHIRENLALFDFDLTEDQMNILDNLSDGERVTANPESIE